MYEIVKAIVIEAEKNEDYKQIEHIKKLVEKFATTINAPSNWRDIGEKLAKEYSCDTWVHEELELWNHE